MQPVLAEDQSEHNNLNSYALPTITVITSKPNKDLVNTGILRQPQLDTIQSNNIASLLEYLPGTSIVGSPRPDGQKINIWGLSDPEDVPVTVDGSLKTFDTYRQGSIFIEPELIKKLPSAKVRITPPSVTEASAVPSNWIPKMPATFCAKVKI